MQSESFDVVNQSQFVKAGAGAGKTTKLIQTFIEFVKEFKVINKRYPRVIMTTFTRKATQEVKERLLVKALSENEQELFEYINKKSFVHISTIHGVLSLFVSQYADRLKFPSDVKIIDNGKYQRILKRHANNALKKNTNFIELLESYSFVQLIDMVSSCLEYKAQHTSFNFIQDKELILVTQDKKNTLIEILEKILSIAETVPSSWGAYFSFLNDALVLLKENRDDEFFELINNEPAKPRWSNAKPPFDPLIYSEIEDLREKDFDKCKFTTNSYIEKHQKLTGLFYQFITEMELSLTEYKRNSGELTISDLESLSLKLLNEHSDTVSDFSSSWDYFMIDEYQDTSPTQVKILNQIIGTKPCFIVGDPQQSIYLFRGARSEVFQNKLKEMKANKSKIHVLETNYRSEPELMNFINDFFTDFSPQFAPMVLKSSTEQLKLIKQNAFYINTSKQVLGVLSQIQYLMNQGVNPQDICVLSRSNQKLINIAIEAKNLGVPVQLQTAGGFDDKREILDLIAFNKFLNNPHDDKNLITLIRSPWFCISDEDIVNVAQNNTNKTLWLAFQNFKNEQIDKLNMYLSLFNLNGSLQTTKQFILNTLFVSFSDFYDKTGKREANIFKFLTSLAAAEKLQGFLLGQFLDEEFQSLQSDLGTANGEAAPVIQPDCVSLMTVHASKGLQFKHVIVIGFADTPKYSYLKLMIFDEDSQKFGLSLMNNETGGMEGSDWAYEVLEGFKLREIAENERVLYVAMTRAIESLSLVAEIKNITPAKTSWHAKCKWQKLLAAANNKYLVEAFNYNDDLVAANTVKNISINVREPFLLSSESQNLNQSVTELLDVKSSQGEINYENNILNLKKAQKGSDLHRIFEALKFLPVSEILKKLNVLEQNSINYLLEQKEIPLEKILNHGHNEWGFGLKTSTRFIQGQIDLWAELEDEIHISDYKTGSSSYSEKAFEQLSFYTMALLQMRMISEDKKIIQSVIYPLEKIIKKRTFNSVTEFKSSMSDEMAGLFL